MCIYLYTETQPTPSVQHVVQQEQLIFWQSAQNSFRGSGRNVVQIACGTPGNCWVLAKLFESAYSNSRGSWEIEAGS